MSRGLSPVSLFGLGAAAMYVTDPEAGSRRRMHLSGLIRRATGAAADFLDIAVRDLKNRGLGAVAEVRYRRRGVQVSDDVLVRRVAAKMGRLVSHPRAVGVLADSGRVTLSGRILQHEVSRLMRNVEGIPGVKAVVNELEVHRRAGNIPDLQGGRSHAGKGARAGSWSPGPRLLAMAGGGLLALTGLKRGGLAGTARTGAGVLLASRALANVELRRLVGLGGGRRGVSFQKTMTVQAPVSEVFEFFADFINFPRFMRHVKEVRALGNGRSHWVVTGPAGATLSWNAVTTRVEPGRLIAWKSENDSSLQHAGILGFEEQDGQTRISARMTYNPPAGLIGHAVATFLGADPKREMDDDFMRAKAFLETGKPARDAAQHAPTY